MLGFIWACVDSDSLTWHDRMSGTRYHRSDILRRDVAGEKRKARAYASAH